MAKGDKATAKAADDSGYVTETLTYVPGEGDPAKVTWAGLTFQANVAREIKGHPDGTERDKLNHHVIESARKNPRFEVSGEKKKRDPLREPKTADEYRAYMADWLKSPDLQHVDQLVARFARDRDLQAACDVGGGDWELIAQLFVPRLAEMQKHDELTDPQVAAIWLSHGYNQLPW